MRRLLQILACSAALASIGMLVAAAALASGTGTSAGDQQYVDPLTNTTPATTTHSSTTPPASPATSSSTTSSSSTPTSSAATAPANTSSTGDSPTTSGTLPFTGLNLEACVAVGIGLLGTGLLLRRTVSRF